MKDSLLAAVLLLLAAVPLSAASICCPDFSAGPNEMRTVFHLTGPGLVKVRSLNPRADKLVVEIEGKDVGESLLPLYRFEESLPARQLNVVSTPGLVRLIWRLDPGVRSEVQDVGARIVVRLLRGGQEPAEAPPVASSPAPGESVPPAAYRLDTPQPARAERTQPPPPASSAIQDLSPPDPSYLGQSRLYRLGGGDIMSLVVHGDDSLNRDKLNVALDGYIDFPLIGRVPAAGRTIAEVEQYLQKKLGESYLVDPDVTLLVVEYNSQWVNIVGAVENPGRYPLRGPTTLLDILSQAGSATERAAGWVRIQRMGETAPVVIDLKTLMDEVDPKMVADVNAPLQHGDIILVPPKRPFSISGEVNAAGQYPVEHGMTFLAAIARAGGVTPYANREKILLMRMVDGKQEKRHVNLKRIHKGKDENFVIEEGDHIEVLRKYLD